MEEKEIIINKQVLPIKDFARLLLATMAVQTPIIQLNPTKKDVLVCSLPANYKQNIEDVLCDVTDYAKKFSNLIDVEEYFTDHFRWESKLTQNIKEVLKDQQKPYSYDLTTDTIRVEYNQKEAEAIINAYPKTITHNMETLARHICDRRHTREYIENNFDNCRKRPRGTSEMAKLNRDPLYHADVVEYQVLKAYSNDERFQ